MVEKILSHWRNDEITASPSLSWFIAVVSRDITYGLKPSEEFRSVLSQLVQLRYESKHYRDNPNYLAFILVYVEINSANFIPSSLLHQINYTKDDDSFSDYFYTSNSNTGTAITLYKQNNNRKTTSAAADNLNAFKLPEEKIENIQDGVRKIFNDAKLFSLSRLVSFFKFPKNNHVPALQAAQKKHSN